ncbi:MAG: hypothetical protein CMJ83_11415 [Planctomycetes bacterium]|nr:hypothetical protein [Planctomycetota bacterium]
MKTRTFSFVECLVLLLLVAAASTVAIPHWTSDGMLRNERGAVEVLREIAEAQDLFHTRNATFAMMEELTGFRTGREVELIPPAFPSGAPEYGVIERDGYLFSVYLAAKDGEGALRLVDPDEEHAKTFWVAYAWPRHYGITGRSLYAINAQGEVFTWENSVNPFSSREARPPANLLGARLGKDHPLAKPPGWVERLSWTRVP